MRSAKIIGTGIVSLLIFLTLILLIEVSIRWLFPGINPQMSDHKLFDPHKYGRTYGYKALATGEELGVLTITDERDFRTSTRSRERNTLQPVLVLGDSVSAGIGVQAEQTYPSLLEEMLDKTVLNASVTGYGIADYVEVLGHIADTFNPHLVIVGICLNDVSSTSQANIVTLTRNKKGVGEVSPDESRYPNILVRSLRYINDNYVNFHNFLGFHSRTYAWLKSLATDSARDHFAADSMYYRNPKTIEFLSVQFAKLRRSFTRERVLLLVIFPYEYQLRTGSLEALEPQTVIKEAGRRAGVTIYDPYDELMEYLKVNRLPSKSIYLFNDPLHFNSAGHHAIAELVYRHITHNQISH